MLRKFVRFVRSLFSAPAPATVTVSSPVKVFEYTVLHSHKPMCVSSGTVGARNECDALSSIYALAGERIQIVNGCRYRVHGGNTFTRIDRAPRGRNKSRECDRNRRKEAGTGGISGE
jgi:hypothetical protein